MLGSVVVMAIFARPWSFHDSFSKPSGNLNRCFCKTMEMFLDSSGANKNSKAELCLADAATYLQAEWKLSEISFDECLFSSLQFSNWLRLASINRSMTQSSEIHENWTFTLVSLMEKCDSTHEWKTPSFSWFQLTFLFILITYDTPASFLFATSSGFWLKRCTRLGHDV